jgi:hypothetical protein
MMKWGSEPLQSSNREKLMVTSLLGPLAQLQSNRLAHKFDGAKHLRASPVSSDDCRRNFAQISRTIVANAVPVEGSWVPMQ